MLDRSTFCSWANEAGFASVGFCDIRSFALEREIVAKQIPLSERRHLRFEPHQDHPEAKSLAVLLWPYEPEKLPVADWLFIDSYYAASNLAYRAAKELELRVLQSGHYAKANVPYPAKSAAVRAGLGIIGRHSMLITPEYGTRVVIILLATDIPYDTYMASPEKSNDCASCGRCTAACPVSAIDEYGLSHPERCLRNFMMEGVIMPESYRTKIGNRLLGCDICQRVCPMQLESSTAKYASEFCIHDFLTDDPATFTKSTVRLSESIGKNIARPQRIRAQMALIAGNSGNPLYLPVLHKWAQSDSEAVRVHALWAISMIEQRNE